MAEQTGRILLEVNFERNPDYSRYLSSPDPRIIFDDLSLVLAPDASPENALLFLDEIQGAPEVFAKLRWFAEEMPELAIIAAGSLLEFALGNFQYSMPVGRIGYAQVEPLDFPEFLSANGQENLRNRLERYDTPQPLTPAVHERASEWFQRFAMVGGMPAAVASDVAEKTAVPTRRI